MPLIDYAYLIVVVIVGCLMCMLSLWNRMPAWLAALFLYAGVMLMFAPLFFLMALYQACERSV